MRWKTVSEDDTVHDGSEIRQQAQKWRGVRNISEVKKEQNSIIITWSFLVTWRRQHLMNCKPRLWSQIYLDTKSTWPVTGFCHWQSYLAFLSLNFLPCRTVVKIQNGNTKVCKTFRKMFAFEKVQNKQSLLLGLPCQASLCSHSSYGLKELTSHSSVFALGNWACKCHLNSNITSWLILCKSLFDFINLYIMAITLVFIFAYRSPSSHLY